MASKEELLKRAKELAENENLTASLAKVAELRRQWRRPDESESLYEQELGQKFEEYLNIMSKEHNRLLKKHSKTNVAMYRALQFTKTQDYAYHCTAGKELLTIMENGDLVPCRRMPIVVGNLLKDNMLDLYKNNKILKDLQKPFIPKECEECDDSKHCQGGLRCLAYALTGSYKKKDPGCNLK